MNSVSQKNDSLLFIGSQFLYCRSIQHVSLATHILNHRNPGIFSNLAITSLYQVGGMTLKVLPKAVFFFYLETSTSLLEEAKIKDLPAIALIGVKENASLVDYPILTDSSRFYNTYFFSFFFFRFLQLN